MSGCPRLETTRLVLRPFQESDLRSYTAMLQSEPVRSSLHLADDVAAADAWSQMASWLGQWELRGTGQWALEEKESGAFVGRAGLHNPAREDWPGVEVGWCLHPDYWGLGYATEGGRRAVDYAFGDIGLTEVCSVILPENLRSIAVAQRLGFRLREERVLSHFPSMPHGIWWLRSEPDSAMTTSVPASPCAKTYRHQHSPINRARSTWEATAAAPHVEPQADD